MQFQLLDSSLTVGNGKDIHDLIGIYGGLMISFISVMLTIVTFLLGFIVANWISKRKEREELENIKKMFLEYETSFLRLTEKIIDNLASFSMEAKTFVPFKFGKIIRVAIDYDFFDALDKEKVYKSLLSDSREEHNHLYYFSKFHHFIRENEKAIIAFCEETEAEIKGLNRKYSEIQDIFHDFMVKVKSWDIFTQEEKENLTAYHVEYYGNESDKSKEKNIGDFIAECINPSFVILKAKFNSTEDHELTHFMKQFNNIRRINSGYQGNVKNVYEHIDSLIEILKSEVKDYKALTANIKKNNELPIQHRREIRLRYN